MLLLLLWGDEGVRMWDEYKQENFNLRALLFVTINDFYVLMTELLPVVLRGILPDNVRLTIVKICAFSTQFLRR